MNALCEDLHLIVQTLYIIQLGAAKVWLAFWPWPDAYKAERQADEAEAV